MYSGLSGLSGMNGMGGYSGYSPYGSSFDSPYSMNYNGLNSMSMGGMGGYGMGGYGLGGMGMMPNGMNNGGFMQGLENYMMTSGRISNLLQMSLQSMTMTVQSAMQLAQTGVMLQTETAPLDTQQPQQPQPGDAAGVSVPVVPPSEPELSWVESWVPVPPTLLRDTPLKLVYKALYPAYRRRWLRRHLQRVRLGLARADEVIPKHLDPQLDGTPSRWWWVFGAIAGYSGWRALVCVLRLWWREARSAVGVSGARTDLDGAWYQAEAIVNRQIHERNQLAMQMNPYQNQQQGGGWMLLLLLGGCGFGLYYLIKKAMANAKALSQQPNMGGGVGMNNMNNGMNMNMNMMNPQANMMMGPQMGMNMMANPMNMNNMQAMGMNQAMNNGMSNMNNMNNTVQQRNMNSMGGNNSNNSVVVEALDENTQNNE